MSATNPTDFQARNITTLVFDLGGVLIELGNMSDMMAGSPFSADEIWANWIHQPIVRQFESGQCTANEFAAQMTAEFRLNVSETEFLERFNAWPRGMMPGAVGLLDELSNHYRLACLSNTNLAHYDAFLKHQPIMARFEQQFLSHKMGVLKPDNAAFEKALAGLDVQPGQILYFDDHPKNVEAAEMIGMQAYQVHRPAEIREIIRHLKDPGS